MPESPHQSYQHQSEEFGWESDEGRVYARVLRPNEAPRAVICLVHGIGEHSGRYGHVAEAMLAAGIAFSAFDHYGHGQSEGKRGHVPSLDVHLRNVEKIVQFAAEKFPGAQIFLYGHSMGGNLALNYAIRQPQGLAGLVVTSPWLRLSTPLPRFRFALMRIMNRIWPSFTLSRRTDLSKLTSDSEVAEFCGNDPLNHGKITARQLVVAIDAAEWALAHASELGVPLLLAHGSEDLVTSPEASREFSEKVPGDCDFRLLDGIRHEPHQELNRKEFIDSVIEWIESKLESGD